MEPALHPDVSALGVLLGTWSGEGHGEYPTIAEFDYTETVTFGHNGKPFLAYTQRTMHATEARPLHAETGYLRAPAPGRVELVLAQPSGIVEVDEGTFDGRVMQLVAATIGRTTSAKEVVAVERDLTVDGDVLSYVVRMAAVGQPLLLHLTGTLHRVPPA